LPEGHLAWFVVETVEQLNIDSLLAKYRVSGKGELAYHPRLMLSLLIYAYCTGTFSSRKIAAQIEDSVAFRVIAAGTSPSHRTICRFREENLDEFQGIFVQVVQLAKEAGLVKMGTVAIDGSKLKANASKHKAMSYERMIVEEKRLREEIAKLTRAARDLDKLEDESFGPDFRGDELPAELSRRETRRQAILAAKKRLEERKAAEAEAKRAEAAECGEPEQPKGDPVLPKPRDQENFTDPDSRIMPTAGKSFQQSFNAQIVVDAEQQIIVGNLVSQAVKDQGLLAPVLTATFEATQELPKRLLADAGYHDESSLALLPQLGIDGYVAFGREGKTTTRNPSASSPNARAMKRKLATKRGRARYKKRKGLVEPVFGWVKRVLGFREFSLRGLRKVAGEWNLVCMALNLRRMATMTAAG